MFTLLAAFGCGDDTSSPTTPLPSTTASATESAVSNAPTSSDTADETSASETPPTPEEGYAIKEDFDDWTGDGGRAFMTSKGDPDPYADHNTVKNIDGQDCLWIHANAVDNQGYGFSIEVQMNLDAQTDMSSEDWEMSYDVYLPAATYDLGANMQFGLYRTSDFTPIYSIWYSGSLRSDEWVTLTTPINTTAETISYSGFTNNPQDWIFDAVRIQAIVNGTGAAVGSEIAFCLDNLVIRKVPKEEQENIAREERIAKPTPYAVWLDGKALPVERLGKFEVPVNYVRATYTGDDMELKVASSVGLEGYTLSPSSKVIQQEVGVNLLKLKITEPSYLILDVPGEAAERLFLLIDPPETETPPAPDGADVRNILTEGADNTGVGDNTELIQAAIDAASGDARNVVYVPAGTYNTRSLFLKDNMTLYLAEGALLQDVTPQTDLLTNPEGLALIEGSSKALIIIKDATGAKLKGHGALDGGGVFLQDFGRKMFLVKIEDSQDIEVDGVIARDSAFWNTLVYRSSNVHISNYKVINNQLATAWNETDGVDFNNCVDSSLTNAFLYTGDDCMAVKSDDIADEMTVAGILDPTKGDYIAVSNVTHTGIVCHSASSGCKVGTKTFGPTMTSIQFKDVDIVQAERGLVIDAVDTATIDQTLFQDIRMQAIRGRLVDFNMDPEAITWRTNPGTCTVTSTTVSNVSADESRAVQIKGNIHDWDETDPYYGEEYFVDGVLFENFTVAGSPVTSLESDVVTFDVNDYARNIEFEYSLAPPTDLDGGVPATDGGVDTMPTPEGDAGAPAGDLEWLPAWATTNQRTEDRNEPPALADSTLRQFVWPSYSGSEIRLQLSNQRGEAPVEITKVHIAKAKTVGTSEIDVDTDVELTWSGSPNVTIAEGETTWSDPIAFDLVEMTQVAITMHFASAPADVTGHPGARTTSTVAPGDVVSDATISGIEKERWYFIEAIEVMAPSEAKAIAILGDSITDGYGISNKFARWPDFLNRAVNKDGALANKVSVLNFGMGGNCLTVPGENDDMDPGYVRFERDVLGRKDKIGWLIVFIGVNDMIYASVPAEDLILAYEDIITKAHAEGIAVYGATITPFEGHTPGDPLDVRTEVNEWLITSNAFDAVIDFSAKLADPRKPSFLNAPLSNDGLHPNEAGYEALADAVDLSLFYTTLEQ